MIREVEEKWGEREPIILRNFPTVRHHNVSRSLWSYAGPTILADLPSGKIIDLNKLDPSFYSI